MLCLDAYLLLDPRPCDKAVLPQPMAALMHISIMADVVLIAETLHNVWLWLSYWS